MKARSIKGNSAAAIDTALRLSMANRYQPTLAFVFLTTIVDIDAVTSIWDDKQIAIFGAGTSQKFNGEGIAFLYYQTHRPGNRPSFKLSV